MKTTDTAAPDPRTQVKKKNALTAGQKPAWTWIAVLVGALVLAGVVTAVLSGGFNWPGFVILTGVFYVIAMYIVTLVVENRRRATDGLWKNLVWGAFLVALLPLISVIWTVVGQGLPTLLANPNMLWVDMGGVTGASDQATVNEGAPLMGGFLHGLIGSVAITAIATLISVPIGLMASIYLVEYSRGGWFSKAITFFVDVMTGIPSIVAGLFAFAAVQLFITTFIGEGPAQLQMVKMGLTAAIALSVLMIPVVVRSTEEMLRVVPNELREASYALGVRKWRTILKVVLPTAMSGIASGVTLAIARVTGETAPILVTAGFAATVNWNVFSGWMTALPVYIYRQLVNPTAPAAAEPSALRAWAAALVLIIIVMVLNLIARIIAQAFAPKKTGR
ncbi:phosphate ABC transporter permease PstA [Brevibacterium sp. CS2]|uniref:phosphate ABC transporter permease PstA n=1 Tax=Brevibacterium sp. CS2 TaxID=2575923 RepID=UPI0010C7C3DD|nr:MULTISPECIES: phosphate ABC transporter permease PstA [Actinomycetes]MCX0278079.1 phosphate ABC transporter permease PstA [Nocardia zapadnayensis]QCP04879.1 phosphate ABC transporter permease PstA [Brevibacterium sp. CS2]